MGTGACCGTMGTAAYCGAVEATACCGAMEATACCGAMGTRACCAGTGGQQWFRAGCACGWSAPASAAQLQLARKLQPAPPCRHAEMALLWSSRSTCAAALPKERCGVLVTQEVLQATGQSTQQCTQPIIVSCCHELESSVLFISGGILRSLLEHNPTYI